jgi:hypothetical protein
MTTEEVFAGADKLDNFFKRMPITEITALKIKDYVRWRRKEGDADPAIRRQLGNLRSAFTQAKALDLITDSHIPAFVLPADSNLERDFSIFQSSILFERLCQQSCDRRLRSCTSADAAQEPRRKLHGR